MNTTVRITDRSMVKQKINVFGTMFSKH